MTLINKVKWIAGILLVFFIVLATNLIDRENFRRINHSVESIYEDRIVANDMIFNMAILIQEKEMAIIGRDSLFYEDRNDVVNSRLQQLLTQYESTTLTNEEQQVFVELRDQLIALKKNEDSAPIFEENHRTELLSSISTITKNLSDLTKIQLKEGKRQMGLSKRTLYKVELFTQVEIIFLVILAILIQMIILYKGKD